MSFEIKKGDENWVPTIKQQNHTISKLLGLKIALKPPSRCPINATGCIGIKLYHSQPVDGGECNVIKWNWLLHHITLNPADTDGQYWCLAQPCNWPTNYHHLSMLCLMNIQFDDTLSSISSLTWHFWFNFFFNWVFFPIVKWSQQ